MPSFHRFSLRQIFIIKLFAFLIAFTLPYSPLRAEQWIVLKDAVRPYTAPSLRAPLGPKTFRYMDVVEGTETVRPPASGKSGSIDWLKFVYNDADFFLPVPLVVKKSNANLSGGNLPIGSEVVDKDHSLPLDYKPTDLVDLNPKWNYQAKGHFQLRAEAARRAQTMLSEAEREGVQLRIASSYRSAASQRSNYLKKIAEGTMLQQVVAKPGHSEHQLGTVLDLSGLDARTSLKPEFATTPEGIWIKENAHRFGFVLSYTPENAARKGYIPEPWHVRYMGQIER